MIFDKKYSSKLRFYLHYIVVFTLPIAFYFIIKRPILLSDFINSFKNNVESYLKYDGNYGFKYHPYDSRYNIYANKYLIMHIDGKKVPGPYFDKNGNYYYIFLNASSGSKDIFFSINNKTIYESQGTILPLQKKGSYVFDDIKIIVERSSSVSLFIKRIDNYTYYIKISDSNINNIYMGYSLKFINNTNADYLSHQISDSINFTTVVDWDTDIFQPEDNLGIFQKCKGDFLETLKSSVISKNGNTIKVAIPNFAINYIEYPDIDKIIHKYIAYDRVQYYSPWNEEQDVLKCVVVKIYDLQKYGKIVGYIPIKHIMRKKNYFEFEYSEYMIDFNGNELPAGSYQLEIGGKKVTVEI